jgi:2-phospho-L-lactate guanylyltransferase (CobY/MobA/RfbA family)
MASDYEIILAKLLAEKKSRLDEPLKDPERNKVEVTMLSTELESLESLIEKL